MGAARPEIGVHAADLTAALHDADALVLPLVVSDGGEPRPGPGAERAAEAYGIDLADLVTRARAGAAAGDATTVTLPRLSDGAAPWDGLPGRLVLVGTGAASPLDLRRAGAALARACSRSDHAVATLADGVSEEAQQALVEGVLLASYRPPFSGVGAGPDAPLARLTLVGDVDEAAVAAARVAAGATLRTRLLAATPSNTKNPQWMADRAQELAHGHAGVRVRVRDEAWLVENGLEGLASVGRGSAAPPRLVTVEYRPTGSTGAPAVLVGKGITYDTGGISIKPREAMIPMKTDMTGAAAVLGAVLAASEAGLPTPVVAVLPLAENAFGAASYRPGDVIRMVDGTHVEIGNTDAEGRMVLADAIAWARAEFAPSVLVDVATLTGAATLGLGRRHAALYATEPGLSAALVAAGERSGELLWPMPLVEEYRHALRSAVADVSHIPTDTGVSGGSITAALFLQRFAGDVPWAHLDIAGPARAPKAEHEVTEGPTGFGSRVLFRWLEGLSA